MNTRVELKNMPKTPEELGAWTSVVMDASANLEWLVNLMKQIDAAVADIRPELVVAHSAEVNRIARLADSLRAMGHTMLVESGDDQYL